MTLICRMLLLALLALGGCAVVGPKSIANGRSVYNEVINHTEDEQVLNVIVRKRYDETFGMLNVASVTANIKLGSTVSSDFRLWGTSEQVDGNLVPLSVGVAYEENPTITYVPLGGDTFLRRMLRPITMEQALLLLSATRDRDLWFRELIQSINGLQNPVTAQHATGFDRFAQLSLELRLAGLSDFGSRLDSEDATPEYFLTLHDYGEHLEDVHELLDLLGIVDVDVDGSTLEIPIQWSSGSSTRAVHFQTRSAFDIIERASRMIDIPPAHIEAGLVEPDPPWGAGPDQFMRIRSSPTRPKDAVVAVPFRDWWYYIDATDIRSKRSFVLIRLLIGMRLEDQGKDQRGPVLTIPAG